MIVDWPSGLVLPYRGAGANTNANPEDVEMKTKLVDNKGDPNQSGQ